jgi:glucosamine--fructose-6-phosphate aminotransferase (isomerizing)
MLMEAGRAATVVPAMQFVTQAPVIGPKDGVIVITHTGETSYALAARALAFTGGLDTVTITKRGTDFPRAIETVDPETSETYTVSYTTALVALALIAHELGAESLDDEELAPLPGAVQAAIDDPAVDAIPRPERVLVVTGAGPAGITAREGALKVREAARVLAEGYDVEYLLHGSAVPLDRRDHLVTLSPPDESLVAGVGQAAAAEGLPHTSLGEPSGLSALLAQIPLTVRLQMLALRFAREGGHDPDRVIVGRWADEQLWKTGAPEA